MLFWIFVAITAGFIIWGIVDDWYSEFPVIGLVASGFITIIMTIIIIGSHATADSYVAENEQCYKSIVYQYENDIYDNDNDLGKRDLMCDIQEWNEDLARNKVIQDNFWLGIFYPNIYDQFEFIELK